MEIKKIDSEFKKLWVEALRSDKYPQGVGVLKEKGIDGITRFCCLGVACDIIPEDKLSRHIAANKRTYYGEWGNGFTLPEEARKYIGTEEEIPVVMYKERRVGLSGLNDDEKLNFNQIADLIEESL